MSYPLYANRDNPYGLWMLDDTAPFQDHSGRILAAGVVSGSTAPTTAAPVVTSAAFSSVFDNTHKGEFANQVYTKGYERVPFLLEAWVYPITRAGAAAQIQILSNLSTYDGLSINGTVVRFAVAFATAGMAVADYDIQSNKRMHVQGFYTGSSVKLIINGETVSETELTDSQKNDVFITTNAKLYSGQSTGAHAVAMNGVAMYANVGIDKILNHYVAGNIYSSQNEVAPAFGGEIIPLVGQDRFLDATLELTEDFDNGLSTNVMTKSDRLTPFFQDSISVAGNWTYIQPLVTEPTSIYAIVLDWNGIGAVVETSLDGITWTTATKNVPSTSVGTAFNPTGKFLWVRVSFAGGVLNDTSFLDNLRIIGYKNNTATSSLSRPVTLTYPAIAMEDHEPIEYNSRNGVRLNGSTITISADANGTTPKTIEVWIYKIADTISYSTAFSGANTFYTNGAVGTAHPVGEWVLKHFVITAGHTGIMTITGDAIVGQVILYPNVLTAAQVATAYQSYTGRPVNRVIDATPLFVAGSSDTINSYSHDWEIVGVE